MANLLALSIINIPNTFQLPIEPFTPKELVSPILLMSSVYLLAYVNDTVAQDFISKRV